LYWQWNRLLPGNSNSNRLFGYQELRFNTVASRAALQHLSVLFCRLCHCDPQIPNPPATAHFVFNYSRYEQAFYPVYLQHSRPSDIRPHSRWDNGHVLRQLPAETNGWRSHSEDFVRQARLNELLEQRDPRLRCEIR